MNVSSAPAINLIESHVFATKLSHPVRAVHCSQRNPCFHPIRSVGRIMNSLKDLPRRAILLGVADDDKPVLLDLDESDPGSILVYCDQGYGKTHQLQVIVDSIIKARYCSRMKIEVLSANPWEWEGPSVMNIQRKKCVNVLAWNDPQVEKMIARLAEIVQQRIIDQCDSREIILVLDEVNRMEKLSEQAQVNLNFIFSTGPKVKVWPVASMSVERRRTFTSDLVDLFDTLILGHISNQMRMAGYRCDECLASELDPGEFMVKAGGRWNAYRLPMIGA